MRKILTFMVSLIMVSCGSKSSRTTDSSQTNDSIYTIENINNISLTQPEKALALLDTIEQRKLLKPNDINGLRAVIYHNGMDQSNVALKYAKRIYEDPDLLKDTVVAIKTFFLVSELSQSCGNYAEALKYANKGFAYALSAGDKNTAAQILLSAGNSMSGLGRNDEAINYIDRALEVLESLDIKDYYTQEMIFYGKLQKLNTYMAVEDYDKAIAGFKNLRDAFEMLSRHDDIPKVHLEKYKGDMYWMFLTCYTEKKMLKEATQCYEEIMKLPLTPKTGQMVAPYLIATKQYDKALDCIREAKRMLAESEDTLKSFYISYVLKYEEDIYKEMGRYKEALYVADNIKNITDSITKREREHEAQEMATIYNLADKEMQISNQAAKLRNGHIIVALSMLLLLIAIVIIFIVVRFNRIIKKKNRAAVATIDELMATRGKLMQKVEQMEALQTASEPETIPSEAEGEKAETEEEKAEIEKLKQEIEEKQLFLDPLFDRNKAVETFPELNIRTLSAEFTQRYGMTFPRYLMSLRINYALSLLSSDSTMSVETIATKSGFATRQTFYRTFTEQFGISPAEYRRMKKK